MQICYTETVQAGKDCRAAAGDFFCPAALRGFDHRVEERKMIKAEKIDRLRSLQEAYILYGVGTRLPFIECEERNYFDQAFIYEAKEDAEEAAKRFFENGDLVGAVQLKTVETIPDGKEEKEEKEETVVLSEIRSANICFVCRFWD